MSHRGRSRIEGFDHRYPTPAEIEALVRRGRRLRALELQRLGRRAAKIVVSALGLARPDPVADPRARLADALRGPLASIRAASEILRGSPDLPGDERQRFLDIVLREGRRLERTIGEIVADARVERGLRAGRISIETPRQGACSG